MKKWLKSKYYRITFFFCYRLWPRLTRQTMWKVTWSVGMNPEYEHKLTVSE